MAGASVVETLASMRMTIDVAEIVEDGETLTPLEHVPAHDVGTFRRDDVVLLAWFGQPLRNHSRLRRLS